MGKQKEWNAHAFWQGKKEMCQLVFLIGTNPREGLIFIALGMNKEWFAENSARIDSFIPEKGWPSSDGKRGTESLDPTWSPWTQEHKQ
jgi:hypothetical protein